MPLILTEEQEMLKQSAKEYLTANAPVAQMRKLRDSRSETGYKEEVWRQMVEMGWSALIIPEKYEGLEFGMTGLGQVLEETGRTLTASPLFSTVILGVSAILHSNNEEMKEAILPKVSTGELTLALAHEEKHIHQPLPVKFTAIKKEGKYELKGVKKFVLDGHTSDKFVVSACIASTNGQKDEVGLFLVDANSSRIEVHRKIMMDSRNAANVDFNNVLVDESARIDKDGEGKELLTKVLDIGRIALSAEMLGVILEAYERTVSYLKERRQFGLPIGSFQALQHRAAHLYCEIELCKTLVIKALKSIDEGKSLKLIASMTKSKMGEVAQLATNESIQMFGGIGMTDDEEIGFFMKRARVAQQTLGDYNFHLDRYAGLNSF